MKARLAVVVVVVLLLTMVAAFAGPAAAEYESPECNYLWEHCVTKTVPVALYAKAAPHAFIGLYAPEYLHEVTDFYYINPHVWLLKLNSGPRAGYWVSRLDTDEADAPDIPPP